MAIKGACVINDYMLPVTILLYGDKRVFVSYCDMWKLMVENFHDFEILSILNQRLWKQIKCQISYICSVEK